MRAVGLILILLLMAPTAGAQAIPDDIPDRPDRSPGDVNRERLTERHRSELSRLFAATHFAVMPFGGPVTADRIVQGGVRLHHGGAIHLSFGVRTSLDGLPLFFSSPDGVHESAYLMSFGYDLVGRAVLGDSPFARRTVVGLGLGTMTSEANMLVAEVNPRYTLYRGQYVSLPVGARLSTVFVSDGADTRVRKSFLGFSVGMQINFAHRDRLQMR